MSRKIVIVTAIVIFLLFRLSAYVPSLPQVTLKLADTTGIVGDTLTLVCLADENNPRLYFTYDAAGNRIRRQKH